MDNNNRIEISLGNGFYLTAERNTNPGYEKEIFIGIEKERTGNNIWCQDLCVVRPTYTYHDQHGKLHDSPLWNTKQFEVLVYGDCDNEDWTENHIIDLYEDEQRTEFAI